ncbi:MAG: hypothetical protein HC921_00435 [Synechococcaceae cyanobacterium SM2_3_1]|nr:hypothetical protein [Synechococcaceae cyanobacterium SM2_3_1]
MKHWQQVMHHNLLGRLLVCVILMGLVTCSWTLPAAAMAVGDRLPYATGVKFLKGSDDQQSEQAYSYWSESKDQEKATYYANEQDLVFLVEVNSQSLSPLDMNPYLGRCANTAYEVKASEPLRSMTLHFGQPGCNVMVYAYGFPGSYELKVWNNSLVPAKLPSELLP